MDPPGPLPFCTVWRTRFGAGGVVFVVLGVDVGDAAGADVAEMVGGAVDGGAVAVGVIDDPGSVPLAAVAPRSLTEEQPVISNTANPAMVPAVVARPSRARINGTPEG
jgi:hypothetical protein